MNERIKQLAKEAAKEMNETGTYSEPKFQEKFAELIIQECATLAFDGPNGILEHFGVKE